jgi:hypothetical protein
MIYLIIIGLTISPLALLAVARRERPWPREGHGVTYFARPALRQ